MYYSRVIMGRIEPENHDQAFSIFTDDIIPTAKEQRGFRGANLFSSPKTGRFIATTIWKTEEDMIASGESGYLQDQLSKVAAMMDGPPEIDYYIVHY